MKRLLILLLCLVLCLTGCANGTAQNTSELMHPETENVTYITETEAGNDGEEELRKSTRDADAEAEVRISVTTDEQRGMDHNTKDGTLLFTRQIQSTTISMPDRPDIEAQINSVLNEQYAVTCVTQNNLLEQARSEYTTLQVTPSDTVWSFYGYSYYTADTITRLDSRIFSMTVYYSSYTGGAHPNNTQEAKNFNLATGELLSLSQVLLPEGQDALETKILDWLRTKASDFGLFEDYQSVVTSKFQSSVLKEQTTAWYFSDNGLVVFFNPYDITPYAAGVVKIEFPYNSLDGILDPAYFPEGLIGVQGAAPILCLPADVDETQYETVEYIDAAEDGLAFAMYGDGTVYDLSLCLVNWVGSQPILQRTVYATNYLSEQNLVIVQAEPAEEAANLCLQFHSGSGTMQRMYFGLSCEDGSYYWFSE